MKTFADTIRRLPFEQLWELLNNPRPVSGEIFTCLYSWMNPKQTLGQNIVQVCLDSGACASVSDVRRKIKEGSLTWNGQRITDKTAPTLVWPGWGVVCRGKKNHFMVVKA